MFMRKPPENLPALLAREDATERTALAEATPLLPRVEQQETNCPPILFQDTAPFHHRWRRTPEGPSLARGPCSLKAGPGRILVDGIDNGPGKREAPLIYLFMGLHSVQCSIPKRGIQSIGDARSELTGRSAIWRISSPISPEFSARRRVARETIAEFREEHDVCLDRTTVAVTEIYAGCSRPNLQLED
jgi:hypothetical protein